MKGFAALPRFSQAVLLCLILATTTRANNSDAPTCFRDLLQSYSLNGYDSPVPQVIAMCPSISNSCCQPIDQEVIYSNWIHGQEEQTVNDRYNSNAKVYETLIDRLIQVQDFARTVRKSIVKRVANCKLLSERILNFEVREIQTQIRKNLNKMRDFFKDVYKGFYCSVCNYDNHKFFDQNNKVVVLSEKFCRDIIENSLGPLLVFHVDMMKYLNLVTKFVTSCDTKGEYNLDAQFPKNLTFYEVSENREMLEACRANRNKKDWFSYCKDVCMNFQISSFSSFFEPNVVEIKSYNDFLKDQLQIMSNFQLAQALLNPEKPAAGNKGRVLQETPSSKAAIYKRGLGPKVDLSTYTIDFRVSGISLYDEGRNCLVTDTMYNSVKTHLQLARENSNVNQASRLSPQDQMILNAVGNRALRNTGERGLLLGSAWAIRAIGAVVALIVAGLS